MTDTLNPEQAPAWQRRLASQANNRAWALAESASRSTEESEEMLQAAHAAMYLWKLVGTASNIAHAALLLAHVYALLGLGRPAAHYWSWVQAQAQPLLFFSDAAQPWERALAHAVAANVASVQQDTLGHATHHAQAVKWIAALPDAEDRKVLNATLAVIPVPAVLQG